MIPNTKLIRNTIWKTIYSYTVNKAIDSHFLSNVSLYLRIDSNIDDTKILVRLNKKNN